MTEMNNNYHKVIDEVFLNYVLDNPQLHERWLLQQTLYTGTARRSIFNMLPLQSGMKILDVGSGFGAAAFDLAALHSIHIEAVDSDANTNELAEHLYTLLQDAGGIRPESSVRFVAANAYELPYEDNSFDFIISRYLFQHLQAPESAMREIRRVLKPECFACIIDIDDQYTISYPEESAEFDTLKHAFSELQKHRGGDRFVGRKLASYMNQAGLDVVNTLIQPAAQFFQNDENGLSHQLTLQRFNDSKADIVRYGILTSEEFDRCFEQIQTLKSQWQFASNGQMIVLGRRPAEEPV
ncbi:class I SAM-dependent methyltransferase [Alicyclobacillus sp. SO9]|uniref:class I SAM-dependent methyltransferase n=1 Tax=Alicyclobacillus sp. SO9 TaxID=2665646 RepID=UPI0018E7AB82|nr:methyltransferase domain-containing protein [Alicyclobacillus sp. SO9]QQE78076.1 methyltransferase domain-containing protein [Alicyclobacillus sp. SO9]